MKARKFEDLDVWREAHQLTLAVYRLTASFPQKEQSGLTSQMRRASISVPANIAEGFGRFGKGEKIQFYNIAQGSLSELRYHFILSKDLGYIKEIHELLESCGRIAKMLQAMMKKTGERQCIPVFVSRFRLPASGF